MLPSESDRMTADSDVSRIPCAQRKASDAYVSDVITLSHDGSVPPNWLSDRATYCNLDSKLMLGDSAPEN